MLHTIILVISTAQLCHWVPTFKKGNPNSGETFDMCLFIFSPGRLSTSEFAKGDRFEF